MPLVLSEALTADLALAAALDVGVLGEFCAVCVDFVAFGVKKGVFAKVAAALGKSQEEVSGGVMALSETLLSAAQVGASPNDVNAALLDIVSLSEAHRRLIVDTYSANIGRLREHLAGVEGGHAAQYKHLDWRLEVVVASRYVHDRFEPTFTLRLDTVTPGEGLSSQHFTADHAALKRISEALDEACGEMKAPHSRRVIRYIH